jgi:hypothetical protein
LPLAIPVEPDSLRRDGPGKPRDFAPTIIKPQTLNIVTARTAATVNDRMDLDLMPDAFETIR